MASYLRSLFGSSQSTAPVPAHGKAKSRSRTTSTPAPSPYYVQTPPPGTMPSTSSSGTSHSKVHRTRTNSYTTPAMVSSPLRYPTYDSRVSHDDSRPLYRAANHKPQPDTQGPCHFLLPLTHISSSEAHLWSAAHRASHSISAERIRNAWQLEIKLYLFAVSWPGARHSFCAFSTGSESASFQDI